MTAAARRSWRRAVLAMAARIALAACDGAEPPACVPDVATACDCPTGAPGTHVCNADGLEFGACVCSPDAGAADADAGPDASDEIDAPAIDAPAPR